MAIKTEPMDAAAQEKATRTYEKATASSITQISGDIAHRAVGAAALETVNNSLSKIQKDMKDLKEVYEHGNGASKEARDLEESINSEARHAGSIMEIFKKDMPAGMSVDAMNNMIIAGAKEIYGSAEGHVHYHDISAVHDVKSHLRQEVHDTHAGISTNEMNPGDVGSILQNVEARVGELLATSLAAMNVDPEKLDSMLKQIALSAVERDYKGASGTDAPAQVKVAELVGNMAPTMEIGIEAVEKKAPIQVEMMISTFTGQNKNSFAGKHKVLNGLSDVYRSAYHNSEHWPIYGDGPGQEQIPHSWGKQLALEVVSDPKGGAVFVAQDKNGQVTGSLIAVNFASVLDSHSSTVKPVVDTLKAQFGEDTLRKMWYVVDVTVKPDIEKRKGRIELGAQQMGVGTALFSQFEDFIKQNGAVGFLDWTSTENIPMRQGMYKKIGITEMPGDHVGIEANVERKNKAKDPRWYEEGETHAKIGYKIYTAGTSNLEGSLTK